MSRDCNGHRHDNNETIWTIAIISLFIAVIATIVVSTTPENEMQGDRSEHAR